MFLKIHMHLALTEGRMIILSDEVVQRYRLPCNNVSIELIKALYNIEKHLKLNAAPRLKENVLKQNHYEKNECRLGTSIS